MPIRVTASLEGLKDVTEQLSGLEERARDLKPAFEIIADLLEMYVAQQFATHGASGGTPWAALMPRTVLMRTRRLGYYKTAATAGAGPTGPILVWSGRLRSSFRRGSAEHVRIVTDQGLEWGSRDPRAGPLHRRRPILAFQTAFVQRELAFQPVRLWLQGVPPGAIRAVMMARLGLGAVT